MIFFFFGVRSISSNCAFFFFFNSVLVLRHLEARHRNRVVRHPAPRHQARKLPRISPLRTTPPPPPLPRPLARPLLLRTLPLRIPLTSIPPLLLLRTQPLRIPLTSTPPPLPPHTPLRPLTTLHPPPLTHQAQPLRTPPPRPTPLPRPRSPTLPRRPTPRLRSPTLQRRRPILITSHLRIPPRAQHQIRTTPTPTLLLQTTRSLIRHTYLSPFSPSNFPLLLSLFTPLFLFFPLFSPPSTSFPLPFYCPQRKVDKLPGYNYPNGIH